MVKVEKESVALRSLPSPFVCQRGWRSAQMRGGARLLVAVHLLVIVSLLFTTTAAAMPVSARGSRAADATQRAAARMQPSAADANQPHPFLSLAATVNPEAAAAGERVWLRWQVTNLDRQVVEGVTFQAELPDGLLVTPADVPPPLVYDAPTRRLTWVIATLPAGDVYATTVPARLSGRRVGDVVTVGAELYLADGRVAATAEAGVRVLPGAAQATRIGPEGGSVRLEDGRVMLTFAPGAVTEPVMVWARSLGRPINAPASVQRSHEFVVRGRNGEEIHTFSQPVTLTVHYPEGEPVGGRLFVAAEGTGAWEMLPTTWDAMGGALVAVVPHLSQTAEGNNFAPEIMPSLRGWQNDLFSGSASYDYPLSLQPGRGGLTPAVALQFNSRSRSEDGGHSSVVGAGWKLTADSFIYGTPWLMGSAPNTWRVAGAAFSEAGSGSTVYLKEAPTWRILYAGTGADAYTPDGTRYHFERALSDWWCNGTTWQQRSDKWALQYVVDPVGNRINYAYDTALPVDPVDVDSHAGNYGDRVRTVRITSPCANGGAGGEEIVTYLSQLNLVRISYNPNSGSDQSVIDFTYAITRTDAALSDPADTGAWAHYTTRLLTAVKVKQGGSLIAAYKLGYDFFDDGLADRRLYALSSIQRCSDDSLSNCLPATTFSNTRTQMQQMNNGYGGSVRLGYGADDVIATRTVTDTVTGQANTWSYSYVGKIDSAGYRYVTETLPSSLGAGHWVSYQYQDASAGEGFRGKEIRQTAASGNQKQVERVRTWNGTTVGVYGSAQFVYLGQELQTTYDKDGANPVTRKTEYLYEPDHQGGMQAGNLTRIKEYSDSTTLYRSTERWYYPKVDIGAGKYIVNRLAQEKLWDAGNVCQGQTRRIYDTTGFDQHQAPPTQGLVQETWQAKVCASANVSDWLRSALYGYDAATGNLVSETAANGTVTSTSYDATFAAYTTSVSVIPAASLGGMTLTTSYAYYGINAEAGGVGLKGQLQTETDANGSATRYTYDAFGRAASLRRPNVTFSEGASERYTYTDVAGANQPFKIEHWLRDDGPGDGLRYDYNFYDGLGQTLQVQTEGETPSVVSSRYNALGLVVQQSVPYTLTVALGTYAPVSNWGSLVSTQTAYDGLGRATQVTQADGTTVRTYYHSRQTAVVDAANHQAISESDAFGRLASVKQYDLTLAAGAAPNWGATSYAQASYSYDVAGRLKQMTGPDGAATTIGYDLLGRKTSMSDPDMGAWSYAYDGMGNLKRQADARGQQICFYYDGHNRLVGKHYRSDQNCPGSKPTTYGTSGLLVAYLYDGGANGLGGRTQADVYTAGGVLNNRVAYTYDPRGRVTQESRVISGTGGGTFVTQWGYDAADRTLWMKYPGGSGGQVGEQVSYAYTTQGLLDTVIGAATYVGDTQYNVRGQVMERRLGSTTGVVKQLYAYTAADNFRLVSLKAGTSPTYDNRQKINFTYDDDGNIQTMADAAAYGGSQTQSFAYDTLDRLSTAEASGSTTYGGYTQRSYAYSNAGNITNFESAALTYQDAAHKHAVTHIGGVQKYWYDANGNATRRINGSQDVTLTYDAENRLTAMSGSVTASYVYDADGSRVQETIAGVTRVFVSNYYEVDNGTVKKYYYAGATRVAENSGGVLYYLLGDHLGSTALTLDSSGVRQTELRYYPYGGARYNTGGQLTTYRFTGQRWDSGTALYFYQSRWYDPVVGRFLAADTIVPQPQNPQSLNRYSYALGNPLRFVDPSGHRVCEDEDCRKTWPARPPNPSIPSLPFGIPPNAVQTTTPVITTYWTPQYDPQPDAAGTLTADPNLWAERGRGSLRRNAALQGSIVVQGKIWKYILATDSFVARGSPRNNGVPVNYGWVVPPDNKLGRTPEGRYILQVTAAVAYTCPHNVHCGLGTPLKPAYRRGNEPEYTIYVVTDGNVLIVTPLDTGYGLSANQIDIYMGIGFEQPDWIWGSNAHPQAYIVP